MSLADKVAELEDENKELRSAIRECRVCGCRLPTGDLLDTIEAEGVDIRSQLGSETLMRWSVGFCSIECSRDDAQSLEQLRLLNGGGP